MALTGLKVKRAKAKSKIHTVLEPLVLTTPDISMSAIK